MIFFTLGCAVKELSFDDRVLLGHAAYFRDHSTVLLLCVAELALARLLSQVFQSLAFELFIYGSTLAGAEFESFSGNTVALT